MLSGSFAEYLALGLGKEMKRLLALAAAAWTNIAVAEIPASVHKGFGNLALTIGAFFAIQIFCAVAGAMTARRLAPHSQEKRRIVFAIANIIGVAVGALVALQVAGK